MVIVSLQNVALALMSPIGGGGSAVPDDHDAIFAVAARLTNFLSVAPNYRSTKIRHSTGH